MSRSRRAATVYCTFEGCDSVAAANVGASAFCPLHHSAMISMLDRGSAPEHVELPVDADDAPEPRAR